MRHDEESGRWFALAEDGNLYVLCDCGDWESAEESATDLGINPIWTLHEDTAKQWVNIIMKDLNKEVPF